YHALCHQEGPGTMHNLAAPTNIYLYGAPSKETEVAGEAKRTARGPLSVLIADDEHDIREVLHLILEEEGYGVVEGKDGVETLDVLLLSPTPLIVLLDVLMPRLSGYEVLLRVAADSALRSRHVYGVLTAARLTAERIGPRFAALADDLDVTVLVKPFE